MRSAIDASTPLPDQSFGMPRMPTRKTSRIPTITANFQLRFLFILKYGDSRRLRFRSFFRRRHRDHRCAADFELQIIGRHAQDQRIVLEADDRPAQAAAGYDL